VHVCAYVRVCGWVCIHVGVHVGVSVCAFVCTCVCACVCTCVHACVCCVYMLEVKLISSLVLDDVCVHMCEF
jgi:hypothetical protein